MSIYTAFNGLCEKFILNDVNSQVISMLRQCIGENGDGKFGKDLQDSSHHLKVVVFAYGKRKDFIYESKTRYIICRTCWNVSDRFFFAQKRMTKIRKNACLKKFHFEKF